MAKQRWTEDELAYLQVYWDTRTLLQLAADLGRSYQATNRQTRQLGLKRYGPRGHGPTQRARGPRLKPAALRKTIRQLCLLIAAATGQADPAAVAAALNVPETEMHSALRHAARRGAEFLAERPQ